MDFTPDTKALYTLATKHGWTHQGVKDLIALHFRRTSTKDLTESEYRETMRMLETLPPNTVTTERDPNTLDMEL